MKIHHPRGLYTRPELQKCWQQRKINASEALLLAIIEDAIGGTGTCQYSNIELGEMTRLSESRVSVVLNSLVKRGFVKRVAFDGTLRTIETRWRKIGQTFEKQPCE